MRASLAALLTGATLAGALLGGALPGRAAPAHAVTRGPADPCGLSFPNSQPLHVLSVSSGVGTVTSLSAGGYTFDLERFRDFNGAVRQGLGIAPPAGDNVAPFAFRVPGGHYYAGLTNVVRQGARDRVCLRGVAYRDLGNAAGADQTPPVAARLEGTIGATFARVDLYVGAAHYYVYGRPRTR